MNHDNYDKEILRQLKSIASSLDKISKSLTVKKTCDNCKYNLNDPEHKCDYCDDTNNHWETEDE